MSNASSKLARNIMISARLAIADAAQLRHLMTRDGVNLSEFLRRAIQAYDLMYSRDN